jgi:hypothetical protein
MYKKILQNEVPTSVLHCSITGQTSPLSFFSFLCTVQTSGHKAMAYEQRIPVKNLQGDDGPSHARTEVSSSHFHSRYNVWTMY